MWIEVNMMTDEQMAHHPQAGARIRTHGRKKIHTLVLWSSSPEADSYSVHVRSYKGRILPLRPDEVEWVEPVELLVVDDGTD